MYTYVVNQQMNNGETYFNIYYLSPTCSVASATVIRVLYKNTDKI